MVVVEKKINLKSFDEFSDKEKEKILNNLNDININFDWWDWILEEFKEEAQKLNFDFDLNNIEFSLYKTPNLFISSKSLKYSNKNIEVELTGKVGTYTNYLGGGLSSGFRYSEIPEFKHFENINEIEDQEFKNQVDKYLEDFEAFQILTKNTLKKLLEEYNYLQSEEAIIETIKANEYLFNEETLQIESL